MHDTHSIFTSNIRSDAPFGIQSQLTAGYFPQQNGIAERRNRYINEMTVCMMLDAKLHKRYWGEAVATAAYIKNRTPSRVVEKTPYELWYGQKPDLSYLRVFGCEAYVHIPDEKRGKFDSKAEKLIFVGYDCKANAYRFLNKQTGKIVISMDARILEIGAGLQEEPRERTFEVEPPMTDADEKSLVEDDTEGDRSLDNEPLFEGFLDESLFEGEGSEQAGPRRTQRPNAGQMPKRFDDYVVGVAKLEEKEPSNYKEAITSVEKDKWRKAMDEEYESLLANDTWTLVPLPPGRQAIGSKWVYKQKRDSAGQVIRYKARLVAQGYAQRYGVDFNEVFAPVAMQQTFRVLLTVAGHRKLRVWHIDVKNAYLNGKMDKEQYMR